MHAVEDLHAVVGRPVSGLVESDAEDQNRKDIGVWSAVGEEDGIVLGIPGHDQVGVVAEQVLLLERGLLLALGSFGVALLGGRRGWAQGAGDGRVGVSVVAFAYVPAGVGVRGELGPFARRPREKVRTGVASTPRETSASSLSRLWRGRTEASRMNSVKRASRCSRSARSSGAAFAASCRASLRERFLLHGSGDGFMASFIAWKSRRTTA
ncbi:hypothetical protein [Streptomyces mirabilis]|uniref:hypothetical protein n=1 Tax=Streptomyces mirabilis TaxID=68239 RepID=UPI0036DA13AD